MTQVKFVQDHIITTSILASCIFPRFGKELTWYAYSILISKQYRYLIKIPRALPMTFNYDHSINNNINITL